METNETKFEAYFSGQMSDAEVQAFNAELNSNPDFKEDFEYFLSVKEATAAIERDNFRQKLNAAEIKEAPTVLPSKKNKLKPILSSIKWIIAAASFCVVTYFAYEQLKPTQTNELFAQNFEMYEAQSSRSENNDDIVGFYKEGQYQEFIEKLRNKKITPEQSIMLANAFMSENNFEEAEKALLRISDESSLRDLKYWNLGLTNIQLKKLTQAESHFRHLLSISAFKKAEVEKILSVITK